MDRQRCPSHEVLVAYLEGGLEDYKRRLVDRHLASCLRCHGFVARSRHRACSLEPWKGMLAGIADTLPPFEPSSPDFATLPPDPADVAQASVSTDGYEIIKEIASHGQGVVYEATQRATGQRVALKVMHAHSGRSEDAKGRFEREVRVLAMLQHPNIVKVFDSGLRDSQYYHAMEFIDGMHLDDHVRSASFAEEFTGQAGKTAARGLIHKTLRLMVKVCDAISFAHQRGVIHRDLKPSNIIVDDGGEPHVLDFGLAKRIDHGPDDEHVSLQTLDGAVLGALPYMSPEHVVGDPNLIETRSDVFSLGVILYKLLTGDYPHQVAGKEFPDALACIRNQPPLSVSRVIRLQRDRQRVASGARTYPWAAMAGRRKGMIDRDLETIMFLCLEKDPANRYQSVRDLAEDLRRYVDMKPIEGKPTPSYRKAWKWVRRHRAMTALSTALVVALLGSAAYGMWQRDLARVQGVLSMTDSMKYAAGTNFLQADMDGVHFLDRFLSTRSWNLSGGQVIDRQDDLYDDLAGRMEHVLATNELAPLGALGRQRNYVAQVLTQVDKRYPDKHLLLGLHDRLERIVRARPVMGQGQQFIDLSLLLEAIDPDHAALACHQQRLARGGTEHTESFTNVAPGHIPAGWNREEHGQLVRVVAGSDNNRLLRLESHDRANVCIRRDVALVEPCGDGLFLKISARLRLEPPGAQRKLYEEAAGFQLTAQHNSPPAATLRINASTGKIQIDGETEVETHAPAGFDIHAEHDLQFCCYHRHGTGGARQTFDVILDDLLLAEEIPLSSAANLEAATCTYRFFAHKGAVLWVDDVTEWTGCARVKQEDLGIASVSGVHTIPLKLVRHIDVSGEDQVVHDFDSDGLVELATGGSLQSDVLFWRIDGPSYEVEHLDNMHIAWENNRGVTVIGSADNGLIVAGFKEKQADNSSPKQSWCTLVQFDASAPPRQTHILAQPGQIGAWCAAPLALAQGRSGLAAGFAGGPMQGFELHGKVTGDSGSTYERLTDDASSRPALGSDVRAVAPADLDGDGIDDVVFLGLSHEGPFAYRPVYVLLRNQPELVARELDDAEMTMGITRVACLRASDGRHYVAAASERRGEFGGPQSPRCGLRVWQVELGEGSLQTRLVGFDPGNYINVAAGTFEGQTVFLTAKRHDMAGRPEDSGAGEAVSIGLGMHTPTPDGLTTLWAAAVYGMESKDGRAACLSITNINNEGGDEVVVSINNLGVLLYAVDESDVPCGASALHQAMPAG